MMDTNRWTQEILNKGVLEIAVENIQALTHEEYALKRKDYLGASDSSILCGVNLYKTLDQLITEKNIKAITAEEKEVGEKPIVRKGFDLEPLILSKAEFELATTLDETIYLYKPQDMFKFKQVDGLSVNYDGVLVTNDNTLIPVEAKLVSTYGEKYYNKLVTIEDAKKLDMSLEGTDLATHIKRKALKLGIPPYYYTQCQQEIAGLDAPYGYLAAMFDNSWTFKLFYIPRDEYVINSIYKRCEDVIPKIKRDTN